jgi:acetyl-CoA acetyltransferase family protein
MPEGREAVIVDAVRTPIGRYAGVLSTVRPDDLAARVIEEAVARNELPVDAIDDVVFGCANQAGEDNRNVARIGALLAGLPESVPGVTVNRLCASGMEAVVQAARAVRAGDADLLLAGGVESMTRAPLVQLKPERGFPRGAPEVADTTIGWRFVNPRMAERHSTEGMGETAENVAERYEVTRADQDRFALESHRRAVAAQDAGTFSREIVSVQVPSANGRRGAEPVPVEADEGPRRDTTLEKLAALRPVFREGGTVTAGNSSQINDGAACLVIGSERAAERLGKAPLARLVASGAAGLDPAFMGIGPVPATRRALERAELEIGHPLGATGARMVGTLAWELRERGLRYGLATLCIGVGQGLATIVEAV